MASPLPPALANAVQDAAMLNGDGTHDGTGTPIANGVDGIDDKLNGVDEEVLGEKFVEGLIYPPPEIRSIVDKTASFIAKNPQPAVLEQKIRDREGKTSDRFGFLNPKDAYNPYYRHRVEQIKSGVDVGAAAAAVEKAKGKAKAAKEMEEQERDEGRKGEPEKPKRELEFLLEREGGGRINSVDLDILHLTALFAARSGRRFVSDLSQRERQNYQFDFLRPSHSLFPYFNKLVEAYTKILVPDKTVLPYLEKRAGVQLTEEEEAMKKRAASRPPLPGGLLSSDVRRNAFGRRNVYDGVCHRVSWERWDRSLKKKLSDEAERERIAFEEIDWQDFIVVSAVEFGEGEELGTVELPPPMSINEIEGMTIKQKRMAAMVMEGKEVPAEAEEEEEDADDVDIDAFTANGFGGAPVAQEEVDDTEKNKVAEIIKPAELTGGMKIRKDYVPKAKRGSAKVSYSICQICGQSIPDDEIGEHVRIELLDPRWKEKKQQLDANRSAANITLQGTDVTSNLRQFAAVRTDLFSTTEEEAAKQAEEEAKQRQKEKERVVWDGHAATKDAVAERYQTGVNLDEQIAALHKAKGLLGGEDGMGPRIGPAMPGQSGPPMMPDVSGPAHSMVTPQMTGPTMFAAPQPQPPQQHPQPYGMYPPHMQPPPPGGPGMAPPPPHHMMGMPPSMPGRSIGISMSAPTAPAAMQQQQQQLPGIMGGPPPGTPTGPAAMQPPHSLPPRPAVMNPGEGLAVPPGQSPSMGSPGHPGNGTPQPGEQQQQQPPPPPGQPQHPQQQGGQPSMPPHSGAPGLPPNPYGMPQHQQHMMNMPGYGIGMTRPAEDSLEGEPAAKRQRITKLPDGHYYPEEDWMRLHPDPVNLVIQLPNAPEQGCDGSQIVLEDLPLTLLVGTLRDRIQHKTGCKVGRQRLSYQGKILQTGITLASLNIDEGDVINLSIKDQKKK